MSTTKCLFIAVAICTQDAKASSTSHTVRNFSETTSHFSAMLSLPGIYIHGLNDRNASLMIRTFVGIVCTDKAIA